MDGLLVLRALKTALKKKKMTYRDLGKDLGLSEAAIKKQFQSTDISFNRVLAICRILQISLDVLMEAAKTNPIKELKLNRIQQSSFLDDPQLFIFFLKLSEEGGDSDKVNEEFQFTPNQLWKRLKRLDDIGMIRLHRGTRVELIHGRLLSITTQNTPMSQMTYKIGSMFLEKHRAAKNDRVKEIKIGQLRLSPASADRLKADLQTVYRTHQRQSEMDVAFLPAADLERYSYMIAAGEFSVF